AAQVRQGEIDGDPVRPCSKISLHVELPAGTVDAPEGFEGKVLSSCGIANDAYNPAVDLALKLPEQFFEGIEIALRKSFQQAHLASLFCSTPARRLGFHFFRPFPGVKVKGAPTPGATRWIRYAHICLKARDSSAAAEIARR